MMPVEARPKACPYGHLDTETHEYVINRPDTPTPWLNYLGHGST
jgi:cellobiose phosphorylase